MRSISLVVDAHPASSSPTLESGRGYHLPWTPLIPFGGNLSTSSRGLFTIGNYEIDIWDGWCCVK